MGEMPNNPPAVIVVAGGILEFSRGCWNKGVGKADFLNIFILFILFNLEELECQIK
jgi:hypothetical protein